jgi:hypothetical protein
MGKRARCWLALCLAVGACSVITGCTGTSQHAVTLTPKGPIIIGSGASQLVMASVGSDTSGAGVTWATPAHGTLTGVTTTSATYNASVIAAGTSLADKVTATSVTFPDQAKSLSITVEGAPVISTTSLPDGNQGAAYSSTVSALAGVAPFSWTISSGSLPTGLSLSASTTNSVTISGTSSAQGTFNFTIKVTDSNGAFGTQALSITINPPLNALNGSYAFLFSGFDASGSVAIAGSFTADGMGNLTTGVEDFLSTSGPTNQTFTGTYTLGADNRGVLTFSSLPGSPAFAFAIDPTGAHARMIEFDASGVRGSGRIEQRSVSTCASNTLNGQYAFGVSGQVINNASSSAGPAVIAGSFLATPPAGAGSGSISNSESDANTPASVVTRSQGWSGSFQTNAQATRCTMNILPNFAPSGLSYSVYPVTADEAFLVQIDQVNSNQPFLTSGKLLLQTGYPFNGGTGSALTAVSVGGLTGQLLQGGTYVPDLALVSLTGSSSASFSMSVTENVAGAVTIHPLAGSFTGSDQFGRLDSGVSTPVHPVFYLIKNNKAFCLGEILNSPFFGLLEPQSAGPFTASAVNGDFVLGTGAPATSPVPNISGTVTLANTSTTAGTINGTQDQSTSGVNTAGQAVTGTYSGLNSSTGAGTIALTAPSNFSGDFLVISSTKIVVLSTTASDTHPILIYLGDCTNTCGED